VVLVAAYIAAPPSVERLLLYDFMPGGRWMIFWRRRCPRESVCELGHAAGYCAGRRERATVPAPRLPAAHHPQVGHTVLYCTVL